MSHDHHRPGYPSTYPNNPPTTTSRPATNWDSLRPTWRPTRKPDTFTTEKPPGTDWDSSRPTWKPSWIPGAWTTALPPYTQTHHHTSDTGTNPYDENFNEQQHRNEQWDQTQGSDYPQQQWPHNHGTGSQNANSNDGYHHYHYHQHHQHRYPNGQTDDSNTNTETQQHTPPYGHSSPQKPDESSPEAGGWNSNGGYHHVHHHHHHHHGAGGGAHSVPDSPWKAEESDQETQQHVRGESSGGSFDHSEGIVPGNRRFGQEFTPNRQEHGRTGPGLTKPGYGQIPSPGGNIYVDRNYPLPADTRTDIRNKTSGTEDASAGNRFTPDSWSQHGAEQAPNQNRHWDQGNLF